MLVCVQEDGVGTAIEAIYRDLDYARSLIKGTPAAADGQDDELATIRERYSSSPAASPGRRSGHSSRSSAQGGGAPSSDWSVISDTDDYQS